VLRHMSYVCTYVCSPCEWVMSDYERESDRVTRELGATRA
jgi:hypothetical protein